VPELPEIEEYRQLAERALGRPIATVLVGDPRFVRGTTTPRQLGRVLRGNAFAGARRHGKLLVLELADGAHRLGLRFGMTGRLRVDEVVAAEDLVYASRRRLAAWDRFGVGFADGGSMVVGDPRLLGGVSLDPDESALGPDALSVTAAQLRAALDGSAVALKARLMDQSRVAGIGNLIADELLWRASLSPVRRAGSLVAPELRRLHHHLRRTLADMIERGGSHTGDLMPQRRPGGRCPRDGAELRRSVVGGRTTWWCRRHQR
jgi:formamidopyrimidine-DNA glycosylase